MSSETSQMNSAIQQLSDYQRGVLNELGILCWKKQGENPDSALHTAAQINAKHCSQAIQITQPQTSSKEAALSKLQQLKTQPACVSYAGKVVCSFTPSLDYPTLIQDVMHALELSDLPLITLTQAELAHAKDYVLVWQNADTLAFTDKHLTTPELSKFYNPTLKKQLWQLIQRQLTS